MFYLLLDYRLLDPPTQTALYSPQNPGGFFIIVDVDKSLVD